MSKFFVFAQTVVCCSENAYARRAVREPPGLDIAPCSSPFASGEYPFFEAIFGTNVSLKIVILEENDSRNGPKMKTFGSKFSEKVRKRKSVFGLRRRARIAYEPILWSAQGDPKIEEKNRFQNRSF